MNPGLIAAWVFAKRFWPFAVILALAFVVLYQRNAVTRAEADNSAAQTELTNLRAVNDHNTKLLDEFHHARAQNDAIILDLLEAQRVNNEHSDRATTIIREAIKNDPQTRDWANTPLPDGVRRALNPTEPAN